MAGDPGLDGPYKVDKQVSIDGTLQSSIAGLRSQLTDLIGFNANHQILGEVVEAIGHLELAIDRNEDLKNQARIAKVLERD